MVTACLTVDREKRITVEGILEHPWIVEAQSNAPLPGVAHLKQFIHRHQFEHALENAAALQHMNHDRDMMLLATTHGFEAEDLVRIRAAFLTAAAGRATAGGGDEDARRVTVDEFEEVMRTLGYGDMPWRRMHALFDVDGSGLVDYREFLAGLSKLTAPTEDSIELLFKIYDAGA